MKRILFCIFVCLAYSAAYSQDKGMAVLVFNAKASMDAVIPNEAYGSELSYVVEDSTMYVWSRTDSVWTRYSGTDVTVISTSADTSSITDAVIGDVAYITKDSIYVRGPNGWLLANSTKQFAPVLTQAFDRLIQLDGCSTSETVITGFQL